MLTRVACGNGPAAATMGKKANEREKGGPMLGDNIKAARESRGLSQEELAAKLNVVRQTVSKWERGLSVPDADLLIVLSEATGVPVSALLGEGPAVPREDGLEALAAKLEAVNLQLARQQVSRRRVLRGILAAVCAVTVLAFVCLAALDGSYLGWNLGDPETAVAATSLHAFEWVFVRTAPFVLAGAAMGLFLTRRKG